MRLEGSLYDFDRWSLELRRDPAGGYTLGRLDQVDMVRLAEKGSWLPWVRGRTPVLGGRLGGGISTLRDSLAGRDGRSAEVSLTLLPEGRIPV